MNASKNNRPPGKTVERICYVLFLASIALTVCGINIYRMTLIPSRVLIVVTLVGILAVALIAFASPIRLYGRFWTFFVAAAIGGGISYFSFLFLNKAFAKGLKTSTTADIFSSGTFAKGRSGCGEPYVEVRVGGLEKQLIFDCDYRDSIATFKRAEIEFRNGLWGYPVILSKRLIR